MPPGDSVSKRMPLTRSSDPQVPNDEWVREHYGRIHRAAWMMTGDPWAAEDLAQETFVVAIDKWKTFDGRSARSTWLYGILIRIHRRRQRTLSRLTQRLKNYAFQHETIHNDKELATDPAIQLATDSWHESIWSDVARLPPSQSEAITLRFAQDLSYEEIASAVGCPLGTVKTRVHHGLKRLRQNHPTKNELLDAFDAPPSAVPD
ncbi:MAG: RNA polymerase sigma factor [Pirellulaceae bacterium]